MSLKARWRTILIKANPIRTSDKSKHNIQKIRIYIRLDKVSPF